MEELKKEINELIKKKALLNKLLLPSYILCCLITAFSYKYVQILILLISKIFNLDNLLIIIINEINDFILSYSSLIIYIGSKIENKKISKKIENLNLEYKLALEKNKRITEENENFIKDRDSIIKLYSIVERFDKLPRDKQMEILNYIKGDLTLKDKYKYLGIDKLSNKYKEHLQTECEDILFPDYEEDENNYTKKREK